MSFNFITLNLGFFITLFNIGVDFLFSIFIVNFLTFWGLNFEVDFQSNVFELVNLLLLHFNHDFYTEESVKTDSITESSLSLVGNETYFFSWNLGDCLTSFSVPFSVSFSLNKSNSFIVLLDVAGTIFFVFLCSYQGTESLSELNSTPVLLVAEVISFDIEALV